MLLRVDGSQFFKTTIVGRYVTEASSIGISPGKWPGVIQTMIEGVEYCFRYERDEVVEGELAGVYYYRLNGEPPYLFIFND